MSPAAQFTALEVQPEFSLFGRRLQPYSIGHAKLLDALALTDPQTIADLALVVSICSRPASRALRALKSRWARFWIQLWVFWLGIRVGITSGRTKSGPFLIALGAREYLKNYFEHHWQAPQLISRHGDTGQEEPIGAPALAVVEYVLTSKCGVWHSQLPDLPLNRALWLYCVAREQEGVCRMLDLPEFSEDFLAQAQKQADELQAKLDARARNGARNGAQPSC